MPRQPAWVLNREAMDEFDSGMVKGMEQLALRVLEAARPPIASAGEEDQWSPLSENNGTISYLNGKKVGGLPGIKKPKALTVRGKGAVVGVGYGFPGRFNEMGAVHQPARPFLTPAVMQVVGDEGFVVQALKTALTTFLQKKARKTGHSATTRLP